MWSEIFGDCETETLRYHQFFSKRQHTEFDVYSWDEHPGEETDFFAVDDDDLVLPFAMFESFSPDFRSKA
jgi:hypothetical protein